jgi:hypothetical protein
MRLCKKRLGIGLKKTNRSVSKRQDRFLDLQQIMSEKG